MSGEEYGEIDFISEEIGKWKFQVCGTGLPPTKFKPKVITGAINKDYSGNIMFKNPFK